MFDAAFDGTGNQMARFRRIIFIISERVGDRFWNHNLGGEMDDGADMMFSNQPLDQSLVAKVANDQGHALGYGPAKAGGEIIQNHGLFARVQKLQNHMAADIAGAPCHQNAH